MNSMNFLRVVNYAKEMGYSWAQIIVDPGDDTVSPELRKFGELFTQFREKNSTEKLTELLALIETDRMQYDLLQEVKKIHEKLDPCIPRIFIKEEFTFDPSKEEGLQLQYYHITSTGRAVIDAWGKTITVTINRPKKRDILRVSLLETDKGVYFSSIGCGEDTEENTFVYDPNGKWYEDMMIPSLHSFNEIRLRHMWALFESLQNLVNFNDFDKNQLNRTLLSRYLPAFRHIFKHQQGSRTLEFGSGSDKKIIELGEFDPIFKYIIEQSKKLDDVVDSEAPFFDDLTWGKDVIEFDYSKVDPKKIASPDADPFTRLMGALGVSISRIPKAQRFGTILIVPKDKPLYRSDCNYDDEHRTDMTFIVMEGVRKSQYEGIPEDALVNMDDNALKSLVSDIQYNVCYEQIRKTLIAAASAFKDNELVSFRVVPAQIHIHYDPAKVTQIIDEKISTLSLI